MIYNLKKEVSKRRHVIFWYVIFYFFLYIVVRNSKTKKYNEMYYSCKNALPKESIPPVIIRILPAKMLIILIFYSLYQ